MPTLQIRNLPQDLYEQLKESAKSGNRSLTQEVIVLLKKALLSEENTINLKKLRAIEKIKKFPPLQMYNPDEIQKWIHEDRKR